MENWVIELTTGDKVIVVTHRSFLPKLEEVYRIVRTTQNFIEVASEREERIKFNKRSKYEVPIQKELFKTFVQWTQELEDAICKQMERDKNIAFTKKFIGGFRKFSEAELLAIYECLTPEVMRMGRQL